MARIPGIGAEQFDPYLADGILAPGIPHQSSTLSPFGADINYIAEPGGAPGTSAIAVDVIRAVPFLVKKTGILNRIGFNVTVGAGQAQVGIYSSDPSNGYYPKTLLFDSGAIDTSGVAFKSVAINIPVQAGQLLWLVYRAGAAAPTITTVGGSNVENLFGHSSAAAAAYTGCSVALAFGALPAAFPAAAALGTGPNPMIFVRYA